MGHCEPRESTAKASQKKLRTPAGESDVKSVKEKLSMQCRTLGAKVTSHLVLLKSIPLSETSAMCRCLRDVEAHSHNMC